MRPLLRWAGSKKKLLGRLRPYWMRADAKRYFEPFAGSAALFFDLEPASAVLSDTNASLIEFYQTLRQDAHSVYELASGWETRADTYYRVRGALTGESDPVQRSAMFLYLNRNCFNGIYRTNGSGHFNVPFAPRKTGALPTWGEVETAVRLLRNAELVCKDFRSIVQDWVQPGDFLYLDPPYAVENRRVFVQYNAQTFGIRDLEELSDLLHCINGLRAKFVLSYALSTEALHYFKFWNIERVSCQRNVAGFSAHRRKAMELMISNM